MLFAFLVERLNFTSQNIQFYSTSYGQTMLR